MIYSDHIRFACKACINGHKTPTCTHIYKLGLTDQEQQKPNKKASKKANKPEPIFVVNDQGVGKNQATSGASGAYSKTTPIDRRIKVRLVSATISCINLYCDRSKKFQFSCSSKCQNEDCCAANVQHVFIDTYGLQLVRHKDGEDLPDDPINDPVENYLPSTCDIFARSGISYHHIVPVSKTGLYASIVGKIEGIAKLGNMQDTRSHTLASPYFSEDSLGMPYNLTEQYVDKNLCDDIWDKALEMAKVEEEKKEAQRKRSSSSTETAIEQPDKRRKFVSGSVQHGPQQSTYPLAEYDTQYTYHHPIGQTSTRYPNQSNNSMGNVTSLAPTFPIPAPMCFQTASVDSQRPTSYSGNSNNFLSTSTAFQVQSSFQAQAQTPLLTISNTGIEFSEELKNELDFYILKSKASATGVM